MCIFGGVLGRFEDIVCGQIFDDAADLGVPPSADDQNMKSVRQVVDSLTRVLEGKDVSDLVAMAKGDSPASTT